jgi:hypothetical protein
MQLRQELFSFAFKITPAALIGIDLEDARKTDACSVLDLVTAKFEKGAFRNAQSIVGKAPAIALNTFRSSKKSIGVSIEILRRLRNPPYLECTLHVSRIRLVSARRPAPLLKKDVTSVESLRIQLKKILVAELGAKDIADG